MNRSEHSRWHARRDMISDGAAPVARMYARGVGFEFLFAVGQVSAQVVIPSLAEQAGKII
jgi:hypothetical protein